MYVPLDVILYCGVEVGVKYGEALALSVGKLFTNRDIVSVTVDDAHCDDVTMDDVLRKAVVEGLIERIDGDKDGLAVTVPVRSWDTEAFDVRDMLSVALQDSVGAWLDVTELLENPLLLTTEAVSTDDIVCPGV